MFQAVHWNADLLNKLVTRVNTLEASAALVTTEIKQALDAVNDLNNHMHKFDFRQYYNYQ